MEVAKLRYLRFFFSKMNSCENVDRRSNRAVLNGRLTVFLVFLSLVLSVLLNVLSCTELARVDRYHFTSFIVQYNFHRFKKSLHYGGDACVSLVVVTLGTATVERRTLFGRVQAGVGGAAQPLDA